ncbi:OprD family outer membrane porin [Pseudomonas sp. 3A(2025)]
MTSTNCARNGTPAGIARSSANCPICIQVRYWHGTGSDPDGNAWEHDAEARHVVQDGKAKGLSFGVRQASYRSHVWKFPSCITDSLSCTSPSRADQAASCSSGSSFRASWPTPAQAAHGLT